MSEVEVRWQRHFDAPENITWGVHRIRIVSSTSDHLQVERNLEDVQIFSETLGAAVPTVFYQYSTANGDRVAIDSGTVGDDHWVITKHRLGGNANSGSL